MLELKISSKRITLFSIQSEMNVENTRFGHEELIAFTW